MKCQICKRKTDWDSSVGYINFLVCNSCMYKMRTGVKGLEMTTRMDIIFTCGKIRESVKEATK